MKKLIGIVVFSIGILGAAAAIAQTSFSIEDIGDLLHGPSYGIGLNPTTKQCTSVVSTYGGALDTELPAGWEEAYAQPYYSVETNYGTWIGQQPTSACKQFEFTTVQSEAPSIAATEGGTCRFKESFIVINVDSGQCALGYAATDVRVGERPGTIRPLEGNECPEQTSTLEGTYYPIKELGQGIYQDGKFCSWEGDGSGRSCCKALGYKYVNPAFFLNDLTVYLITIVGVFLLVLLLIVLNRKKKPTTHS